MFESSVITYIKSQLNCEDIIFGRLDWFWTDGSGTDLLMTLDKQNNVDGILIMNFGINLPGAGGLLTIQDKAQTNRVVYQNKNDIRSNLLSPFVYFAKSNRISWSSNLATVYGINYITIKRKDVK